MTRPSSPWKISIDTGGTFTDCLAESPAGKESRLKVLSNSILRGAVSKQLDATTLKITARWRFGNQMLSGYDFHSLTGLQNSIVDRASEDGTRLHLTRPVECLEGETFEIRSDEEVPVFAARLLTATPRHESLPPIELRLGTTRGTNALLERKGARVIFLVTEGFKDLLTIRDQRRPHLFALNIQRAPGMHQEVIEVRERINADGQVAIELTEEECARIAELVSSLADENSAIALSLLHSYKYPAHEQQLAQYLLQDKTLPVSQSAMLSASSGYLNRSETAVVNAYLAPIMERYLQDIRRQTGASIHMMSSAGTLVAESAFYPKEGLLSGPAGGVKGASSLGRRIGIDHLVSFDMGGTSTDVSLYNGQEDYTFVTTVGPATIQSPGLAIETIAAGGGSICHFNNKLLQVGPESAGATPGPASYGQGGPLTVTDVNLLAGRISPDHFAIPLDREAADKKLRELLAEVNVEDQEMTGETLIMALLRLANEKMSRSILHLALRKGEELRDYTLVAFGGAGGQHACDLAEELHMSAILAPFDGGVLSASGIKSAELGVFREKEIMQSFDPWLPQLRHVLQELIASATEVLTGQGYRKSEVEVRHQWLYLRFSGQESTVEIPYHPETDIPGEFRRRYEKIYGHFLDRTIEVASVKVQVTLRQDEPAAPGMPEITPMENPVRQIGMMQEGSVAAAGVFRWSDISPGACIAGPALLTSDSSTLVVKKGWQAIFDEERNARLQTVQQQGQGIGVSGRSTGLALFSQRFLAVVEDMGAQLQRTSFSVNIRERVDFSCALLDSQGYLIMNAPHIPVHLGSMGICVRSVIAEMNLAQGDVIMTNHPAHGGSHLPDITLIAPVWFENRVVAYVANRAHHAEIGGLVPGSMPPHATSLEEEGVVLPPSYIVQGGKTDWSAVKRLFLDAPYPSRAVDENIADLQGALASIRLGIDRMTNLCKKFGTERVTLNMKALADYGAHRMRERLLSLEGRSFNARETLDDGHTLAVGLTVSGGAACVDFSGTSPVHPGNLNATPAIVQSVLLYTLRLLIDEDFPLNEGLMRNFNIILPAGLLNPDFKSGLPAVAGGNTEVSQRLTDTLLKALEMAACSQGTMNNVIFGNDHFGYYETIGGGTGAGKGFHGTDGIHQHMTNTRITDPEIMELRFPVRVIRFAIRENSGGNGYWKGGSGICRCLEFLQPVELSIVSQHRKVRPYGLQGGEEGQPGVQYILYEDGTRKDLEGMDSIRCPAGSRLIIETPGGGGYGQTEGK